MFDKDELKEVKSWMKEIRRDRKEIAATRYDDVAEYCVARHEDTINLLLGMSKFLEENIDLFYDRQWDWYKHGCSGYSAVMRNNTNPVRYYDDTNHGVYRHIWIPHDIKFLYHIPTKRVLWVTHECSDRDSNYESGPDMERWKWNYFKFWQEGKYPTKGYEDYVRTPTVENYFGLPPRDARGWAEFKRKVDEDWKNAQKCKECLKEGIQKLLQADQETLSIIKGMKDGTKEA